MLKCDCDQDFYNQNELDEHQKTKCTIWYLCRLCDETVLSSDKIKHLNICGSKTTQCVKCSKYILRGRYNYHLDSDCNSLEKDDTFNIKYSVERKDKTMNENNKVVIPCEFCEKQIQLSLYQSHAANCRQNSNFSTILTDYNSYENNTQMRSTENKSSKSYSFNQSEVLNSSIGRMNLNSDGNVSISINSNIDQKENAASIAHNKTEVVRTALSRDYYKPEIEHATEKLEFNIILMGSPRVGKSQLINALCGGGVELAKTSSSLNSCTTEVKCYTLEDNQQRTSDVKSFRIYFYDTPGIESWIGQNGQETMLKFIAEKNPICLIYCASPGTFADLKQLQSVLKFCQRKTIFCALVCTNMWSNSNRHNVIEEFEKELKFFGEPIEKLFEQEHNRKAHKVTIFGDSALCTMVNSKEYYDPDISDIRQPIQGVDELIHCIMEKLDHDKLLGWCYAVLYRRSYWEKFSQKLTGFFSTNFPHMNNWLLENRFVFSQLKIK